MGTFQCLLCLQERESRKIYIGLTVFIGKEKITFSKQNREVDKVM